MAVLTETCLSGQISPVALLTLGHFLSYEDCTSEPPHHLRSPEAVSSRTMAGDHCCSTCYLNSSPCHPTVCCWCTIPPLGGSCSVTVVVVSNIVRCEWFSARVCSTRAVILSGRVFSDSSYKAPYVTAAAWCAPCMMDSPLKYCWSIV